MALPLIMMAGAGILSGAQYLMKQRDQENGENMLANLESDIYNGPMAGTPYADMYASAAQQAVDNNSGFFDPMAAPELQQLQQQYRQDAGAYMQGQQQRQLDREALYRQTNEGHLQSIQEQNAASQESFGVVQDQARLIEELYNNADLSGNNLQGMINAVARMQFPNEALNEGDISRIVAGSPMLSQWMNKLSQLHGRADPELARSIYNMAGSLFNGFERNFKAGQKNVNEQIARMQGQGYLPTDRVNRRFGNYDESYRFQPGDQGGSGGGGQQTPPPLPPGMTTKNPNKPTTGYLGGITDWLWGEDR